MEDLNEKKCSLKNNCEERNSFIETNYNFKQKHPSHESLCVRIVKKKYQCIMLVLAITFILLEIIKMILQAQQSMDDIRFISLLKSFPEKNESFETTRNIFSIQTDFPEYMG